MVFTVADDGDGAQREEEESTREGKPNHFAGCPPKSFQNTDCSLPKQQPLISLKHGSLLMLFPVLFFYLCGSPSFYGCVRILPIPPFLQPACIDLFMGSGDLLWQPLPRWIFCFHFECMWIWEVRTWWLTWRFYRPVSSLVSVLLNHSGCVCAFSENQNCAWALSCGCGDFLKWLVAVSTWWLSFTNRVSSLLKNQAFFLLHEWHPSQEICSLGDAWCSPMQNRIE